MNDKYKRERASLIAAMDRLLAGTPLRAAPGALTQTALAIEAGLHRSRLVNVHTDLRDQFEARKNAAGRGLSPAEERLNDRVAKLEQERDRLRGERDSWKAAAETFARAIQVLRAELDDARKRDGGTVVRLPTR
jgi:chromosome segregation ATPase